jgi:hypothetical protein
MASCNVAMYICTKLNRKLSSHKFKTANNSQMLSFLVLYRDTFDKNILANIKSCVVHDVDSERSAMVGFIRTMIEEKEQDFLLNMLHSMKGWYGKLSAYLGDKAIEMAEKRIADDTFEQHIMKELDHLLCGIIEENGNKILEDYAKYTIYDVADIFLIMAREASILSIRVIPQSTRIMELQAAMLTNSQALRRTLNIYQDQMQRNNMTFKNEEEEEVMVDELGKRFRKI